jgi:hypothetical protein
MGSAIHAVSVNGLCASRLMGRARAFAAAADAVAARPDAVVSVVRVRETSINHETVAVVSRGTAAPVDVAPVDVAPVDAYHVAWLAADSAAADLVPLVLVAETVDAAVAECSAHAARVAATRQTSPNAYETACRVRDVVADRAYARVVDAVANAADGFEPNAVAVVVVPPKAFAAYAMLQRSGVACIRPAAPEDCAGPDAWCGTDGARPTLAFANVADALTYATGRAAPRARRSPILPGETVAPFAPSHGAAAPKLPRLGGAR